MPGAERSSGDACRDLRPSYILSFSVLSFPPHLSAPPYHLAHAQPMCLTPPVYEGGVGGRMGSEGGSPEEV